MIENNWLFIAAPVLLLGILGLLSRLMQGSWFAPGPFFALYWFIFTVIPLIGAPEYPVCPSGIYWILISSLAVCSGSLLCMGVDPRKRIHPASGVKKGLNVPSLNCLIILSTIIGTMVPVSILFSEGYLNLSLFSMESIRNIARRFSIMRYAEGYSPPLLSRILTVWIYIGALLGGIRYLGAKTRKERLISFLPFVPALLMTVILTTKVSMLFAVILFSGAAITVKTYMDNGRSNLSFLFKPALYSSLILFPLVFIADILRGGKTDWMFGPVWEHLKPYFFGHLAVFTTWFETNWVQNIDPQIGAFSLAGLFNMLGIHPRAQGLYSDVTSLDMLNSNVYTMFRGLIQDFTLLGSLFALFAFGMISGVAYNRVARGEILFVPLLACFYIVTAWSFVVSVLNYNSILFALIFLFLYVAVVTSFKPTKFSSPSIHVKNKT